MTFRSFALSLWPALVAATAGLAAPTLTLAQSAASAPPPARAAAPAPTATAAAQKAQKAALAAKRAALGPVPPRAPTKAEKRVAADQKKAARIAATEPVLPPSDTLSEGQLEAASHVLLGEAECEFKQTVMVEPIPERPGHFKVAFNKATYVMVPEETTTGAVRLTDRRAGVTWLQIPVKSMLMNQRAGQRLVDSCRQSDQRAAVAAAAAVTTVGPALGIEPQAVMAAPAVGPTVPPTAQAADAMAGVSAEGAATDPPVKP